MNYYKVTMTVGPYDSATGLAPPPNITLTFNSLQHNFSVINTDTTQEFQLGTFKFVYIPSVPNAMATLKYVDKYQGGQVSVNLVYQGREPYSTIPFGRYGLTFKSVLQPEKVDVLSTFVLTPIFTFYDINAQQPTFNWRIIDPAVKTVATLQKANSGKQYDSGITMLPYDKAIIQYDKAFAIGTPITFTTTDFDTNGIPSEPLRFQSWYTASGLQFDGTDVVVDFRQALRDYEEDGNLFRWMQYTTGRGGFNVLIKIQSFQITKYYPVDPPPPTPNPFVDLLPLGFDETFGINEIEMAAQLEDMSPESRAAARKKLYVEALNDKYDNGDLDEALFTEMRGRILGANSKIQQQSQTAVTAQKSTPFYKTAVFPVDDDSLLYNGKLVAAYYRGPGGKSYQIALKDGTLAMVDTRERSIDSYFQSNVWGYGKNITKEETKDTNQQVVQIDTSSGKEPWNEPWKNWKGQFLFGDSVNAPISAKTIYNQVTGENEYVYTHPDKDLIQQLQRDERREQDGHRVTKANPVKRRKLFHPSQL